jgi:hypothetical protein
MHNRLAIIATLFLWPFAMLMGQDLLKEPLSLSLENQSFQDIVLAIEEEVQVPFFFQQNQLPEGLFSYTFESLPLAEALNQLLSPYGLGFSVYQDHAVILGSIDELEEAYNREYFLNLYEEATTLSDTLKKSAILMIGDQANPSSSGIAIIRGTLLDRDSDEEIKGATIRIPQRKLNLRTDRFGEFLLRLPLGDYLLRIEAENYEPIEQTIRVFSNAEVELNMDIPFYLLDEVELSANSAETNLRSVQPGLVQLNIKEIKELPAFLGEADVIKSLLIQPGISTVGEGASGFNVRGGNIDQNLILQDGAMIFNSSHILGFFSVFNADALENLALYKGHIPAQHGGRIASVLEVETKEGSYKKLKGEGGLGLVSARMLLDGPLREDKTSFVLGVRSFYPGWVLPFFGDQPDIRKSAAFFADGNFKIDHRFSETSFLSLSAYASYDLFRYSDQYGFDWSTQMGSLEYRKLFSANWSATTHVSAGNYFSGLSIPEGPGAFRLQTGIRDAKISQQFLFSPNSQTSLHFGVEGVVYQTIPQALNALGPESFVGFRSVEGEQGLESAIFANLEIPLGDLIAISAGIRFSAFQNLGPGTTYLYQEGEARQATQIVDTLFHERGEVIQTYWGPEPRLSMRLMVDEFSSFKLSYGRHRQYLHLLSNTSAATPVDIWQISNHYVPPQISDNFSVGFFRNFGNGTWETGIDAYYRDISSIIEYKDLPTLLLNEHLETELVQGVGRAYGIEISARKNIGDWQGDFSYTYARSLRQAEGSYPDEVINLGNWYPSNFDSPHNLNLALRRKVRKSQLFAVNFVYRRGRPITAPVGDYFIGTVNVPHYSPRNLFRIPDYHRLDLAYTFKPNLIKRQALKSDFTISVYNLYFRRNPFSLFFRKSNTGIPLTYRLAILGSVFPSFTWNFRF